MFGGAKQANLAHSQLVSIKPNDLAMNRFVISVTQWNKASEKRCIQLIR
jgi:hypothetical protein